MTAQARQKPRDHEEDTAFEGMGQAITEIRERHGMSREELAAKCDVSPVELGAVERGELDESWGIIRRIAKALGMPLDALMIEAEEFAPGPSGEAWRQNTQEDEANSTTPEPPSDAGEGKQP
ncbi:MAG TPA: helix-turn-helix transcriptional regulator [Solirubrobacterales bacterium]